MDKQNNKQKQKNLIIRIFLYGLVGILTFIALILIIQSKPNPSNNNNNNNNTNLLLLQPSMNNLTLDQASQIFNDINEISQMLFKSNNKTQQKHGQLLKREMNHKIKQNNNNNIIQGITLMDENIINKLRNSKEIMHLIFNIMDTNRDKTIDYNEMSQTIHNAYKHSNYSKEQLDLFIKSFFNSINSSQPFTFNQFQTFFQSFLLSIVKQDSITVSPLPPFQLEEIKSVILYLSSERRIWDNCLLSIFKILNVNKDEYVDKKEIKEFLYSINQNIWKDASSHIESIFSYMRLSGCASGDQFNLGQLITFGELIRPYIPDILQKYIH